MSDVMLYGILRMPFEMAMNDKISQYQFYQTAQQALDRMAIAEEKLEDIEVDSALDVLVGEMNTETLDWAQNRIDILNKEVKRLQQICESHIRSEYEGTSLLDGLLAEVYGDDKHTQR